MVRFLLLLTWLLLSLTKANNVQAACYAGTWTNGLPVYSSLFVDGGTTLAQCQAVACQAYPGISPTCPQPCQQETQSQVLNCPSGYNGTITQTKTKTCPANVWGEWVTTSNTCVSTCQPVTQTQTLSCPANHTGQITQTNTKTCPDNQWQGWVTSSSTCVANPPTCVPSTDTKTESCGLNFSGQKNYTKQNTCPDPYGSPVQGAWVLTSNTCTQNPPSCKTTTETQTLQCQTGFTGSIIQTRSSMCPDPYGSPVWQPWVTTSDTCKKSINNPTNPTSPVNPASPTSQNLTTSAQTIQSSPVTVPTPTPVPNLETTPTPSTETSAAPTAEGSVTSQSAPTSASETKTDSQTTSTTQVSPSPKGKVRSSVGLALSLELFVKPGLQQANVFPEVSIVQGISNNILMQDLIMMDLLQQPSYNQPFDAPDLGFEQ